MPSTMKGASLLRRVLWWTGPLALAAAAAVLVWAWAVLDAQHQDRVMLTALVLVLGSVLLLGWSLFLSGYAARTKKRIFLSVLAIGVLGAASLELRGFDGDLVPILGWRFAPGPRAVLPRPPLSLEGGDRAPEAVAALAYPQFLGPNRDGTLPGVRLATDWSADPPEVVWRRPVGRGWSSFAVAGGLAVTQEQYDDVEAVVCYDLADGEVRWVHGAAASYASEVAGDGPRATPTLVGGRVFTVGGTGLLDCLDLESGRELWEVDVLAANGASNVPWGFSCSPLVLEDRVVVSPGGPGGRSLVAYDATTGERSWAGGDDGAGYSSPSLHVLAGVPQILILNAGSLAAHDPSTGELLWEAPWGARNPNVAQPVVLPGDRVVVSSGYGVGCALFQVSRDPDGAWAARRLWKSLALKAKFSNFVHRDGVIYGLDDGVLAGIDIETGRRRWKAGRYGHGQLILLADSLLVLAESGEVVLVAVDPDEHRELARFRALDGRTWNSGAFAVPYLLVRNDREAVCLRLPIAAPPPR